MLSGARENALPLFANGKMSPPTTPGGTETAAKGSALFVFAKVWLTSMEMDICAMLKSKFLNPFFWQLSKAFNILAPSYILKKRKVTYLKYSAPNSQPFHLRVAVTCPKPSNLHHLNLCTIITALYCKASPLTWHCIAIRVFIYYCVI